MTQTWVECLIHQRVLAAAQKDLDRLGNGPPGTSCSSTKGNATSRAWVGITPVPAQAGKQLPREGPGGPEGQVNHEAATCPCSKAGQRPLGLREAEHRGGRRSLPSALVRHSWRAQSGAAFPSTRWACWQQMESSCLTAGKAFLHMSWRGSSRGC